MLQAKDACYVLVRTSTEGFDLYQRLVDAGVPAALRPATLNARLSIVREFGLAHSKFVRMRKPKLANGKLRYMLA